MNYSTPLVPFARPLEHGEVCAWCYDARNVGCIKGETWTTHPCTFCGEYIDGPPGERYGNPFITGFDSYARWRRHMETLRAVDLRAAVPNDRQFVAEGVLRQRFPAALHFCDRFNRERGFPNRTYPDPVRFWILTNPDFAMRQLAPEADA